ncbi:dTDP-4-dehydrorhamnose 3,5-epimerase [mine drainage metagenome]|uniref:dTDP-4-dehydrorhamnose 3,5-epimerase n=1 Tax=mine drainage metagenome TaxID=410659 RepID=T0YEF6_9ZZZZ
MEDAFQFMPFVFSKTVLNGVMIIQSKEFNDSRGFFKEAYKRSEFRNAGIGLDFVQDNHSYSNKGVIRGIHFQNYPNEQGKLVSVIEGEIFDVAVDLRPDSMTFSKWYGAVLSGNNGTMLWIPPGFAHGFQALKDSHVCYKVTSEFSPKDDGGVRWNDTDITVKWPLKESIVSDKDSSLPFLKDLKFDGGVWH